MLLLLSPFVRAGMQMPDAVAFSINGVSFYWFGVLFAVGMIVALVLTYMEVVRKGLDQDTWIDLCLVLIPCGIIGARVWYMVGHMAEYRGASFLTMLQVWDGGLSVYGAVVFCLAGLFAYALRKKVRVRTLLDAITPGILLAQAVIVWGDFFQQQNYGRIVENPALQWFPFAVLIEKKNTIHYAVFFYEFLICIAIFCVLWFGVRKRTNRHGKVFAWYLTLYFGARALLNLLRESDTTLSGMLRPSQLFCMLLFLCGVILLFVLREWPKGADTPVAADLPESGDAAAPLEQAAEAGDSQPQSFAAAVNATGEATPNVEAADTPEETKAL